MVQKRFGVTSHFVATIALALLAISSVAAQTKTSLTAAPTKPNATTLGTAPLPTSTSTAPAPRGPKAFVGLATASTDETVYFQGGQVNAGSVVYSGELFAMDVTKSWPIGNPAWTNLTIPSSGAGGPVVAGHSATMSKDESTLYVTAPSGNAASPFLYEYNVQAMTWSTQNAPAADAAVWSTRKEAQLVTDLSSGSLWYVGGSYSGGATNELDQFTNGAWNANVTTSPVLGQFSSGTAQIVGEKIYLFGGLGSTGGQRSYQSFQSIPYIDVSTNPPTTGVQLTLGTFPASRQDHCSVYTGASQKVIVYGGYDANSKVTLNDIWSLDLVTMTWQQAVTTNPTSPRYSHSCNLVGANMIVYGGMAGTASGYIGDTQVYDIMLSTWMSSYAPKQDTTPPSKPLSGGGSSGSQGLSTGALVGIIVGVAAVLGLVLGGVLYRRRQKRIEIREAQLEKEAYLASLGTDDPDTDASKRKAQQRGKHPYGVMASPNSTSTRHLNDGGFTAPNSPGVNHYAMGSPGLGGDPSVAGLDGAGGPNIQYLMQQLPDGTIAVQPVYLDHQAMQSPGTYYGDAAYPASATASPRVHAQNEQQQAYFAPPPPTHNTSAAMNAYGQPIQSSPASPTAQTFGVSTPGMSHGYVMPPSVPATPLLPHHGGQQWQNVPMPPPSTHDPYGPAGSPLPPSASPKPPRSPRTQ